MEKTKNKGTYSKIRQKKRNRFAVDAEIRVEKSVCW